MKSHPKSQNVYFEKQIKYKNTERKTKTSSEEFSHLFCCCYTFYFIIIFLFIWLVLSLLCVRSAINDKFS